MKNKEETLEQFCVSYIFDLAKEHNVSPVELIQPVDTEGYPKLIVIIPSEIVKVNIKDPNFDKPYSELTKTY